MLAFKLALQMLLTMALGFIGKRCNIVDDNTVSRFSKFLLQIGIPCIILHSLDIEFDPKQFQSAVIMLALAVGVLLVLFLFGLLYRKLAKDEMLGAVGHFSIMFPNYTFIGVPVMQSLYGATGLFYYTIFSTPVRIFFYSLPSFILDRRNADISGMKKMLKAFVSPQLISLYIGLIIYLGRIPLPSVISNVLSNGSTFASTGGMMLCGMLMADCKPRELFKRPSLLILPFVCNVIAPCIILLLVALLPIDLYAAKVCVMYAALPMAAMLPIWVMRYNDDHRIHETCSLYVTISTIMSVGTLPLMSWLIDMVIR